MIKINNVLFMENQNITFSFLNYTELYDRLEEVYNIFGYRKNVYVYIYDNVEALSRTLGCKIPIWVKGVNYYNRIYLIEKDGWYEKTDESMLDILMHEYIHTLVSFTFKSKCPIWLNEGLAMICSGQHAISCDGEIVDNYPYYEVDYSDNNLYVQSYYIVNKLIEKIGLKRLVFYAKKCQDFRGDDILGEEALKLL